MRLIDFPHPRMSPARPGKCDRCNYDDAVDVQVPEYFQDQYQDLCEACADTLARKQYKLSDWGD